MDPNKEKLKTAEFERERYLEKLRAQAGRRENGKEMRDRAIQQRQEHEVKSSQQFLQQITRRAEFRGQVKNTWLESHKTHEEMHKNLGKLYKERLTWHVDRTLASASLRTGVDRDKTAAAFRQATIRTTGESERALSAQDPGLFDQSSNQIAQKAGSNLQQLPTDSIKRHRTDEHIPTDEPVQAVANESVQAASIEAVQAAPIEPVQATPIDSVQTVSIEPVAENE